MCLGFNKLYTCKSFSPRIRLFVHRFDARYFTPLFLNLLDFSQLSITINCRHYLRAIHVLTFPLMFYVVRVCYACSPHLLELLY
jgi:hypothetical protein